MKTSHQLARELLALPDLPVMHLDPSFADACDEETNYTLGVPTAEVVDPFIGLDTETVEELKESGVGSFITICGDQPEEWDRKALNSEAVPRRRVMLELKLGADSRETLYNALYEIERELRRGRLWGNCLSGGYSSGYVLDATEDEAITHESYFKRIHEMDPANSRDEGRAGNALPPKP